MISLTCLFNAINSSLYTATLGSVLPYISLNNTNGVTALFAPQLDDECSPEIELPNKFPLGNQAHFKAFVCLFMNLKCSLSLFLLFFNQVCTNGYISFGVAAPHILHVELFDEFFLTPLVAPYLIDINHSFGVGNNYII